MRDFTLNIYRDLLLAARASGYEFSTVVGWLGGTRPEHTLILRHDVDRLPGRALRMAQIEAENGVAATYYFRNKPHVLKREIVRAISNLGHEIGYHYEVLSDANGDIDRARALFNQSLETLRSICPIQTATMHGRPLSKYDNRLIWDHMRPEEFGLTGEGYLAFAGARIVYLTDTGRTWGAGQNVRDRVTGAESAPVRHTSDVIEALRSKAYPTVYLSAHPERWTDGLLSWTASSMLDAGVNFMKFAFIQARRIKGQV